MLLLLFSLYRALHIIIVVLVIPSLACYYYCSRYTEPCILLLLFSLYRALHVIIIVLVIQSLACYYYCSRYTEPCMLLLLLSSLTPCMWSKAIHEHENWIRDGCGLTVVVVWARYVDAGPTRGASEAQHAAAAVEPAAQALQHHETCGAGCTTTA